MARADREGRDAHLHGPHLDAAQSQVDRLKSEQARERQAVRDEHFARTRGITLQHAKASLMTELQAGAANANGRSAEIKQSMAAWRRRNEGRDFGREM